MDTTDWSRAKYAFNLKIKSALNLARIETLGGFGGILIFRLQFSQKFSMQILEMANNAFKFVIVFQENS
jgi:hypothetical protein